MSIQFYFDSSMSVIKSIHRKYGKRLYGTQNFLNVYFSYIHCFHYYRDCMIINV